MIASTTNEGGVVNLVRNISAKVPVLSNGFLEWLIGAVFIIA
jgi:hypothetical protein